VQNSIKKVRDRGIKRNEDDNKVSRILLIDDWTDSISLFRTVLEEHGL
jgi:hypothetical protein